MADATFITLAGEPRWELPEHLKVSDLAPIIKTLKLRKHSGAVSFATDGQLTPDRRLPIIQALEGAGYQTRTHDMPVRRSDESDRFIVRDVAPNAP